VTHASQIYYKARLLPTIRMHSYYMNQFYTFIEKEEAVRLVVLFVVLFLLGLINSYISFIRHYRHA
jgi:putative flippase GtrA